MGEQILDGTELLDKFLGVLGTHAWASGDVVGGVAHQAQNVDELFGGLDAVFGIDLLYAQNLFLERVIDLDVGGHQLPEVLVSRDHIGEKSLLLGLVGEGADDIVGLIALNLKDGDAVGLQDAFDVGDSHEDAFGRLFAVGLVGFVILVPEGLAAWRVEAHGDVRRPLALEQVLQGVDKAEHGRCVDARRGNARAAYHCIECPENQSIGIQEEEFLVRFHNRWLFYRP